MRGNYQEAIELYSKAIELNDQNAIYFSNRRLIDRVWPPRFLSQWRQRMPKSFLLLLGANVYYTLEDYDKAVADCQRAI